MDPFGPLSILDKIGLDKIGPEKIGLDKIGVDKIGVDKIGVDKIGVPRPSSAWAGPHARLARMAPLLRSPPPSTQTG
jgi:hypothetical protein